MQLKLKRSQKTSGMLSKSVVFCLDARAEYSQEEKHLIDKYKLGAMTVYDSAAAAKHVGNAQAALAGGSLLKGAISAAMAKLSLTITIESLGKGHHVEIKDLEEMLAAEQAIIQGCENIRAYLDAAVTFDGREVVMDFSKPSGQIAA